MASDPRFARLTTDPRFRRPKQKQLKVELDDRFKHVLQGEEFGGAAKGDKGKKTDKYGRRLARTDHADKLKQFYRLRSPSPSAAEDKSRNAPDFIDYARGEGALDSSGSEDGENDDDEAANTSEEEDEVAIGGNQRKRIPGRDISDDESVEDSEDEGQLKINLSEDEDADDEPPATTSKSAFPDEAESEPEEETIDPTTRIAIVNMDWDNLRSLDIYKVFSSILSSEYNPIEMPSSSKSSGKEGESSTRPKRVAPVKPDGKLMNVKIYPSEFGKERMAREEVEGPAADLFVGSGSSRKGKGVNGRPKPVRRDQDDDEDDLSVEGYDGYGKGKFVDSEDEDAELSDNSEAEDGEEVQGSDHEESDGAEDEDEEGGESDGLNMLADEPEKDEDVDMDKLRSYQLERLRYYYAIATFSTTSAAQYIFKECNGTEFERTANVFDMSYVPEEMDFEDEPKEATKEGEESKSYKGNDFVTDALRHSKVKLTWDQDDPNRVKVLRRTLTRAEMEEDDFTAYLASTSGEDDDEADDFPENAKEADFAAAEVKRDKRKAAKEKTERLRQLLLSGGDDGADVWGKHSTLPDMKDDDTSPTGDMEITFKAGLTASTTAIEEENLTTLERYQRRMKEKKERKKEKKELKAGSRAIEKGDEAPVADEDDFFGGEDDEDELPTKAAVSAKSHPKTEEKRLPEAVPVADDAMHFSMQDIVKAEKAAGKRKRVRKSRKDGLERDVELGDEAFDINVKDDRFKAIFEEPAFAIDPSNPHYVKTKAMSKMLGEGTKRRQEVAQNSAKQPVQAKQQGPSNAEPAQKSVEELVASVKRKMAPENGDTSGEVAHKKRKRTTKPKGAAGATAE